MMIFIEPGKLRIPEQLASLDGQRTGEATNAPNWEMAGRVRAQFARMAVSTEQQRGALLVKMAHSDGEVEAVDDFPWWRLVGHRSGQSSQNRRSRLVANEGSNLTTIELVLEIADEPIATDRNSRSGN
jgi:hypothetical protein